ncbi:MAG: alpha/beta hydrolase [Bacilli bacterium]
MKKFVKKIINKVSTIDLDTVNKYELERKFNDITHITILKKLYKSINTYLFLNNKQIPIGIFFPKEETNKVILYFHGGGFISGNISNYNKVCSKLAVNTKTIVVSIDYPLAPEHPYPEAVNMCYDVVKYFITKKNILDVKAKNIILMGDSAGGNIAAVISLMARDKKEFKIKKQILIYPLIYHDHSSTSRFDSVITNGADWLLTCKRINDYMELYVNGQDVKNPYITPLNAKSLKHQPKTLIITAQYDPLRDEGEEYGQRLKLFNNKVIIKRIEDTIHGFFSFPIAQKEVIECYKWFNYFINGDDIDE